LCRFSDAGMTAYPRAEAAGVRKAPRHEIAGWGRRVVPRALCILTIVRRSRVSIYHPRTSCSWQSLPVIRAELVPDWHQPATTPRPSALGIPMIAVQHPNIYRLSSTFPAFLRLAASALALRNGRDRGHTSARKCTREPASASSLGP